MAKQKTAYLVRRLGCYVLGLFVLAMGVTVSVKSDLGVSPVSVLPYVLSVVLELDMGLVTAAVFTLLVLLQWVVLGRRFRVRNLLQVPCGMLFGAFVSLCNALAWFDTPSSYALRLLMLAVSVALIGTGIFLFLAADIMPQPPEGLSQAIEQRTGWYYPRIKVASDCTYVALAALLSLLRFHALVGVREGTVIAAVFVGVVLGVWQRVAGARLYAYLGIEAKEKKR